MPTTEHSDKHKRREKRKSDKRRVKSLWNRYAPAAWWPVAVDESQAKSLSAAYSLRELRQMASQMGIDSRLSKMSLARCIVTEKNIFFPNEAGNYDHDTLVFFVRQFQLVADLNDDEAKALTSVELQSILLDAWKGGTEEAMDINLQHVIELHEIMEAMEDKFCSSHVKKLFRESDEDNKISFYDYVENSMTAVLDLYQQWLNTEDTKAKRKIFVATQMAYSNAETAVTEYLHMIRKYCKTESSVNDCDSENIPPMVMTWFRTSTWDDRIILCNVTVKGRNVDFAEGDELLPGYTIGIAVRVTMEDTRENVVWLGIGKPNEESSEGQMQPPYERQDQVPSRIVVRQHPGHPDYSVPFNPVELGHLMDLYERQPRGQAIHRTVQQQQQIPIPQAQGQAQSIVIAQAQQIQEPQQQQQQQQQEQEQEQEQEPTGRKFTEKAKELAKDMLSMGMDVAKDALIGLLLLGMFKEPTLTFTNPTPATSSVSDPVVTVGPSTMNVPDTAEPVNVEASNPVPPSAVARIIQQEQSTGISGRPVPIPKIPAHLVRRAVVQEVSATQLIRDTTPPQQELQRPVMAPQLLQNVTLPSFVKEPTSSYPLVTVPQYTPPPMSLPDENPHVSEVFSTALVSVGPKISEKWTNFASSLVYDLFRTKTPQGYFAFPIIVIVMGDSQERFAADLSTSNSSIVPVFRSDPTGGFQVTPILPTGGELVDPTQQPISDGTFVPSVVIPRNELDKLQRDSSISNNTDLQQLDVFSRYQPEEDGGMAYINISKFLKFIQDRLRNSQSKPERESKIIRMLRDMSKHLIKYAVTVGPIPTLSFNTSNSNDVSIITAPRGQVDDVFREPVGAVSSVIVNGLTIMANNTTSTDIQDTIQRLLSNLRLMFLQHRIRPQVSSSTDIATTISVNPHALANQIKQISTADPSKFYNIDPNALERFKRYELDSLYGALERSKIRWKDLTGGYRDKGMLPFSMVRTTNIWDTYTNIYGILMPLDSDFVASLCNLDKIQGENTKDETAQAVRDLQTLGNLIYAIQHRIDSRSRAATEEQPQKFTMVDVYTAVKDLQRDSKYHGFMQRYGTMLRGLILWQNMHVQETFPWPTGDGSVFVQETSRQTGVYSVTNSTNVISRFVITDDTIIHQTGGTLVRLGTYLNAVQTVYGTPIVTTSSDPTKFITPKLVFGLPYSTMIRLFIDYITHIQTAQKFRSSETKTKTNSQFISLQPDLPYLNSTTDDSIQRATEIATKFSSMIPIRDAAKLYITQAQLFRHHMNKMFADQAQTRLSILDLNMIRNFLARVPSTITVNVQPSVLQNTLAGLGKIGLTRDDITKHLTPSSQPVVSTALIVVDSARPMTIDVSEPPQPYIIPDMPEVAKIIQNDPLSNGRLRLFAQKIQTKFPVVVSVGGPTSSAAAVKTSLLEGNGTVTTELGKFPILPVPKQTIRTTVQPRQPVLQSRPISIRQPVFDFGPPTRDAISVWYVSGPKETVHVKLYPKGLKTNIPDVSYAIGAIESIVPSSDLTPTLDLWKTLTGMLPKELEIPTLAPDFSWLYIQLKSIYDKLEQNPIPDHISHQNGKASIRSAIKAMEQDNLQEVPGKPFECPVICVNMTTDTIAQTINMFQHDHTDTLIHDLQHAWRDTTTAVRDISINYVLPFMRELFTDTNTLIDVIQQKVKEAQDASLARDASQYTEQRTLAQQRLERANQEMSNAVTGAYNFVHDILALTYTLGSGSISWINQWDETRRRFAAEEQRKRTELDARNYEIWKHRFWDGITDLSNAPGYIATKTRQAIEFSNKLFEVTVWMMDLTWHITSEVSKGLVYVGSGATEVIAEGLVSTKSGYFYMKNLLVSWDDLMSGVGKSVKEMLQGLNSSVETVIRLQQDITEEEAARQQQIQIGLLNMGGLLRSMFNSMSIFVATMDLSWAKQIIDFVSESHSIIKVLTTDLVDAGSNFITSASSKMKWTKLFQKHARIVSDAVDTFMKFVENTMRAALRSPTREMLRDRFGRQNLPIITLSDYVMDGFYKWIVKREDEGQINVTTTDGIRRDLQRYGIKYGQAFSAIPTGSPTTTATQKPKLIGPVPKTGFEDLTPSDRVRQNKMKSRAVSRASIRRLRRSEQHKLRNMNAIFHKNVKTKSQPSLTLTSGVPSYEIANQPSPSELNLVDAGSAHMVDQFFRYLSLEDTKHHTAQSVREALRDQLEAIGNALTSVHIDDRPAAAVGAIHAVLTHEDIEPSIDTVVCLAATLSPIINGFYSMVYNRDLMHYCFVQTTPTLTATGKSYSNTNILSDPSAIGIIMDPSWRAQDAESVLRGLQRYKYPSTPFCMVGATSGPMGALQCIPIFSSSVPVSGESMMLSMGDGARSKMMISAALTALSFIQNGTTIDVDGETWEGILARVASMGLVCGAPMEETYQNMTIVNEWLDPNVKRSDEKIKNTILKCYASGVDPLSNEYFKVPFQLSPFAPTLVNWQKASGLTELVGRAMQLERNGIYGVALLTKFRDWLALEFPMMMNIYDGYLQRVLRDSILDRNLTVLSSIQWLNGFMAHMAGVRSTDTENAVFSHVSPLSIPFKDSTLIMVPSPMTAVQDFPQQFQNKITSQFGPYVNMTDIPNAICAAQDFLNTTKSSLSFAYMCAAGIFARELYLRRFQTDITPAFIGMLMLQGTTAALVCKRIPRMQGNQNVMWQAAAKMIMNISWGGASKFNFHEEENFGSCKATELITGTNMAHALCKTKWKDLPDAMKDDTNEISKMLNGLRDSIQTNPTSIYRVLEPVCKDMECLLRANGSRIAATMWSSFLDIRNPMLQYITCLASENTDMIEGTDQSLLHESLQATPIIKHPNNMMATPVYKDSFGSSDMSAGIKLAKELSEQTSWGVVWNYVKGIIPAVVLVGNPFAGVIGLGVIHYGYEPAVAAIANTTWWNKTSTILKENINPWLLNVTMVGADIGARVVISIVIGKFVAHFSYDRLDQFRDLLLRSPLEAFLRAGSLSQQLDVISVADKTRDVVEALQNQDLVEASIKVLGTSPQAIDRLFAAYDAGDQTALTEFITSCESIDKSQYLSLLNSIEVQQVFSGLSDMTRFSDETLSIVYNMAIHARETFESMVVSDMSSTPLFQKQSAILNGILSLVDYVKSGNTIVRNIPGLEQQLAILPVMAQVTTDQLPAIAENVGRIVERLPVRA